MKVSTNNFYTSLILADIFVQDETDEFWKLRLSIKDVLSDLQKETQKKEE